MFNAPFCDESEDVIAFADVFCKFTDYVIQQKPVYLAQTYLQIFGGSHTITHTNQHEKAPLYNPHTGVIPFDVSAS